MLRRTPKHVRECHDRAAECRRRADATSQSEIETFWLEQEARWIRLARSEDFSARLSTFLELQDGKTFSPEAEQGVKALADIFDRVCRTLALDRSDDPHARKVARTLIEAAIAGESDPDALFDRAVKAVAS